MKKALAILVGLVVTILITIPAYANDGSHRSYRQQHDRHYYSRDKHSRHERRHEKRHERRHRKDNDDLAWFLGGLIVGAVVVDTAHDNRRTVTCYYEPRYDAFGDRYYIRMCN